MIGKAPLDGFPKAKWPINKPLYQVHMDAFSSSVKSTEGYIHELVLADAVTGYQCMYGMKTKDDMIQALKKWCSDIANLRAKIYWWY